MGKRVVQGGEFFMPSLIVKVTTVKVTTVKVMIVKVIPSCAGARWGRESCSEPLAAALEALRHPEAFTIWCRVYIKKSHFLAKSIKTKGEVSRYPCKISLLKDLQDGYRSLSFYAFFLLSL